MDNDRLREFRAALAFRHTPHMAHRSWKRLLDRFGCAGDAFVRPWQWLKAGLVPGKACQAFRRGAFEGGAAAEFEAVSRLGWDVVLWTDPDYPERLRHIPDPPLFLYCIGRRDLLNGPAVAVVGSRTCSTRGLSLASRICEGLSAAGVTVVSGMAWGIDRQAHLSGLSGPGSSVAVLGTGLDRIYPSGNADLYHRLCAEGLVVTEFAPGTKPEGRNFPFRNRIVSGLSLGVVVVEAAKRSGSRITARLGLEQGREVYAVPGSGSGASFEGCDELMEQGARSVTSAGEVILDLAELIKADARRMRAAREAVPDRQLFLAVDASSEVGSVASKNSGNFSGSTPSVVGLPLVETSVNGQSSVETPVTASPAASFAERTSVASSPKDASSVPEISSRSGNEHSASAGAAGREQRPVPPPADPDQRAVIELLTGGGRVHIDQLSRDLDWDVGRLSRTLAVMEITGAVRQWPGMLYALA